MGYWNAVATELRKSWWNSLVVVVFTIGRLLFGWSFLTAGWAKATSEGWLSDGKFDAGGLIKKMVGNIHHSHGSDPLHLNGVLAWVANHIFLPMGGVTDFLVIAFEIVIGLLVIFGFRILWAMIAALFLNLQFITAGSANNFGYIVTDIVWLSFPKYAGLIGVDGYLAYRKGKALL